MIPQRKLAVQAATIEWIAPVREETAIHPLREAFTASWAPGPACAGDCHSKQSHRGERGKDDDSLIVKAESLRRIRDEKRCRDVTQERRPHLRASLANLREAGGDILIAHGRVPRPSNVRMSRAASFLGPRRLHFACCPRAVILIDHAQQCGDPPAVSPQRRRYVSVPDCGRTCGSSRTRSAIAVRGRPARLDREWVDPRDAPLFPRTSRTTALLARCLPTTH